MDRNKFLELLGPLPEPCPTELDVVETMDCDYLRHLVHFNVESEERVAAFLCIPQRRKTPGPAVYCHHQHAGEFSLGKSEVVGLQGEPTQAYAHELAELGFVTLAPDAVGFESRSHPEDPNGYIHHLLKTYLIQGKTLLGKILHDMRMGISALAEHPLVDPGRLGFIGHSYGGRSALFAPAIDRRIRASVSACGCTSFQDMLAHDRSVSGSSAALAFFRRGNRPRETPTRFCQPRRTLLVSRQTNRNSRKKQRISLPTTYLASDFLDF